jgi:DNA (cytosine-5)-methyltransferase 1
MADGTRSFNFPPAQVSRLRPGEIVVDLFAGGGGASEALKQALGIDPALAYNHDEWAIGMHAANHPLTSHHREDIWHADPVRDVAGRKVGWFHASPDCTHFSQAKGGQPRSTKIRALSWVVLKWVGQLWQTGNAPRIVSLENVWAITSWGPLISKRDPATGRVLTLDRIPDTRPGAKPGDWVYRIADRGERVPVERQQLVPDKKRLGRTWRQFVSALRSYGYVVEWRKLRADAYGAGTSRERLFLLARRDGEPIVWPAPTHGPGKLPPVSAASSIDFSDLGRSIFDRPKPLADATLRRIAKGVVKHVLQAAEPFFLTEFANASTGRTWSAAEPLRTQCAGVKGGHFAMVAPTLAPIIVPNNTNNVPKSASDPLPTMTTCGGRNLLVTPTLIQTGYGERAGQSPRVPGLDKPLGTVVAGGIKHGLVSAFLEQANGGYAADGAGHDLRKPVSTITASGSQQRLVSADLAALSPEQEASALRVAAFLISYYGNGSALCLRDPLDTITTLDRLALVTVTLQGTPYVIVDIRLRMLRPHELYRAQGFPPGYVIDRTADGRTIGVRDAVRMVGNSVSPPPLRALAEANLDRVDELARAA